MKLFREVEQATQKAVRPRLGSTLRECKRQKRSQRLSSHGGDVAQTTGQTAAADDFRGMPPAPKMDVFEREVRGDKQFMAGGNAQDSAVIPDTCDDRGTAASLAADTRNERFLPEWQGLTITLPLDSGIAGIFLEEGAKCAPHARESRIKRRNHARNLGIVASNRGQPPKVVGRP